MLHLHKEPPPIPSARKARTNWHLVIWPIIALWICAAIYVFNSEWREASVVALPLFMAAAAFVVFLLNAIAGSITQRRNDLQALDESTSECMTCNRSQDPLHLIDYHSYLFLGAIVVQLGQRGKFCTQCATARIDAMFRRTLWGSLLCPPIILWAWFERAKLLRAIRSRNR
jgi:hypothetical protein